MHKGQSQDYLWQIALTLQHYGVIAQASEAMLQQASAELRKLDEREDFGPIEMVLNALSIFIPEKPARQVYYDTEYVDCGAEYALLVQEYADATLGEWTPEHLRAQRLHLAPGQCLENIDFDFRGQHFHWQFSSPGSDWVQLAFVEHMDEFTATNLSGDFFYVCDSMCTQGALFYYLPRKAVNDLNAILEQVKERFEDLAAFVAAL